MLPKEASRKAVCFSQLKVDGTATILAGKTEAELARNQLIYLEIGTRFFALSVNPAEVFGLEVGL